MAMKLLLLTQKVDPADPNLGFMTQWISAFSEQFETITVICLERGSWNPPANVSVFSLGKERKASRAAVVMNFYRLIWEHRKEYDGVFVHMNQEYMLLGGILWRLWRKPSVLWYNHTLGGILTKVAMMIARAVCHTSPYSYTAGTRKSRRMPAGIDTNLFKKDFPEMKPESILYVGRIAPLKKVDILLEAADILTSRYINFTLDVYGNARPEDSAYHRALQEKAKEITGSIVSFHSGVPNTETPALYSRHRAFVNLTPKGNYDKVVLEAMACEAIPVVSSIAFADIIPKEFIFKEGDIQSLADRLQFVFTLPGAERSLHGKALRQSVVQEHDIRVLVAKLGDLYKTL